MLDFSRWSDTGTLSIPDMRSPTSHPATQATAGRKPTVSVAGNGRTLLTFAPAGPNQLLWSHAANMNSTQKWAIGFWFKATSYPVFRYLLSFGGNAGTYDNCKAEIFISNTRNLGCVFFGQDTAGYNGRQGVTGSNALPAAGTWTAIFCAFDGTQATEALRHSVYVDWSSKALTYSNTGATPSAPLLLRTNAANVPAVIGNYNDTADATYAMDAALGSKIWVFNSIPVLADAQHMLDAVKPS